MAEQKQDDQLEHTYSSYVRIRDVALKICDERWGEVAREGQGYPCWGHAMLLMMMMINCIVWCWFMAKIILKSRENISFESIQNGGKPNRLFCILMNIDEPKHFFG